MSPPSTPLRHSTISKASVSESPTSLVIMSDMDAAVAAPGGEVNRSSRKQSPNPLRNGSSNQPYWIHRPAPRQGVPPRSIRQRLPTQLSGSPPPKQSPPPPLPLPLQLLVAGSATSLRLLFHFRDTGCRQGVQYGERRPHCPLGCSKSAGDVVVPATPC